MLVNEYKPEFQFIKSSEDSKFGQCLYIWVLLGSSFVMSRTDAQNGLESIFKKYI
jgi:hypothetical protein